MSSIDSNLINTMLVESANAHDRAGIIQLWKRTGLVAPYNDPAEDFDFASRKPNSDVLLIRIKDAVVASVMVGHDGHRGWIWYVAVDPDCQKRGFGASIVAAGEKWLKDRGVKKVMLLVRETNTSVVEFYEGQAYEAVPRTVMQKWLVPPE